MLNDIQITSDYMSRWVVLKRRVGAVTSQRVLKVLFYVNILQCDNNRKFLHIPFANKGIDAINISNILNRKEVVKEIPPYFKIQSFSLYPPSGIIFNSIHNYLEIMFPIDVLRFSEFRTMRNDLSETLMLNDIQITSDYMSIWVVLKRRHNFKIIMYAVEVYARRWIQREEDQDPELESLSDWVRTIRSLVQGRIHKLKKCVNSRPKSAFKDQEVFKCLSRVNTQTLYQRECLKRS
jgi:hypothetical protein